MICGDESREVICCNFVWWIQICKFIHHPKKSLAVAQMFGWPQKGMPYVALVYYISKKKRMKQTLGANFSFF